MTLSNLKKNLSVLLLAVVVGLLFLPISSGMLSGPFVDALTIGAALWFLSAIAPPPTIE